MKISKIRSLLYGSAKVLGDISAAKNGKVGRRVKNRFIGKQINKWIKFK